MGVTITKFSSSSPKSERARGWLRLRVFCLLNQHLDFQRGTWTSSNPIT